MAFLWAGIKRGFSVPSDPDSSPSRENSNARFLWQVILDSSTSRNMNSYFDRIGQPKMRKLLASTVDMVRLRKELRIPNGVYSRFMQMNGGQLPPANIPKFFVCWKEEGKFVHVPRNYSVPFLRGRGLKDEDTILNGGLEATETSCAPRDISPSFALRPHQPPAVEALAKAGDKIIALSCGLGKTCSSLYAWGKYRRGPLLILVDTQELARQWAKEIKSIFGMKDEEIGLLQGPNERWKGYSIVIGLIQTVWKRQYPPELYDYFHVVVLDEIHVCGSSAFSNVLPKFSAERWGLSATPERADGNTKLIKLHCGNITYTDLKQPLKPKVYFVQTENVAPSWLANLRSGYMKAMVSTALSKNRKRNVLILDYINKAAEKGRSILVLGERVKQLQEFVQQMDCSDEAGLLVSATTGKDSKKTSLTEEERAEALTKRIVCATMGLAKKGLDKPELDTLIFPFPISDQGTIQQACGRIQRKLAGKKQPLVIVFEDNVDCMIRSADSMRKYMKENKIEYSIIGKKNQSSGRQSTSLQDLKKKQWFKRS